MSKNCQQINSIKCKSCCSRTLHALPAINPLKDSSANTTRCFNISEASANEPGPTQPQANAPTTAEPTDCPFQVKPYERSQNWQSKHCCISEKLNHLYLNETFADVHFVLSDTSERLPAHKIILSMSSEVFEVMFYGTGVQMMSAGDEISIVDVDSRSFKALLRFVYTDEVLIEPDTVMSVLYAAKKYAIEALERVCVDFLNKNLRIENAFMLLAQARLFDELQLADSCLQLIDKYAFEVFSSEQFLDIDLQLLIELLKRDTLGIKESKLFNFVIKWAQARCEKDGLAVVRENLQTVLGDAVGFIRFPVMSRDEFAAAMYLSESRVIKDEQIIDIFLNFSQASPKVTTEFNETPRCCLGGREQVVNRFAQVESRWGYSGTSDRLKFSVNRRIYVVGLGLYGSIYGKYEYQVLIQLIHFESCTICAQNSTSFTCDGTNSTFRVLFKEPIEIDPDTEYVVAATLKGPDSYYGTKGMRTVSHEGSNGNKVTFQFQYASGNNNGSSVEDGQIPEIIFLYTCN